MYAIYDRSSGDVLGVYTAADEAGALALMAQDREGSALPDRDACRVTAVDTVLADCGRALDGPTFRGWRWYYREQNAALLDAAGEPGRYEPHDEACSGFFLSREAAALDALRA